MRIDSFCHVLPSAYAERLFALENVPEAVAVRKRVQGVPSLIDMDLRFRQMDEFDDYVQIINCAAPPVEDFGDPTLAREMARIANEGLADLVAKHPDRFAGFAACVPMAEGDAAVEEVEYAVNELGALGVQIYTHVNGHPLDEPRFEPFWAKMAEIDKVIQVHPCRNSTWSDYPSEERSKFEIWWVFGWEYDLSAFMSRVVFGGVLERYPELKILIHHGGSMVPHFAGRVGPGWDQLGARTPADQHEDIEGYPLTKRPIEYFKQFYADTALFGAEHAVRCSLEFYGADHVLFGSDCPFDPEKGPGYIRATLKNLAELDLSDAEREAILAGNARRLFGLDERR